MSYSGKHCGQLAYDLSSVRGRAIAQWTDLVKDWIALPAEWAVAVLSRKDPSYKDKKKKVLNLIKQLEKKAHVLDHLVDEWEKAISSTLEEAKRFEKWVKENYQFPPPTKKMLTEDCGTIHNYAENNNGEMTNARNASQLALDVATNLEKHLP